MTINLRRIVSSLLVMGAAWFGGSTTQGAVTVVIDDFTSPGPGHVTNIVTSVVNAWDYLNPAVFQFDSAGILGGQRDMKQEVFGSFVTGDSMSVVGFNPGPMTSYFEAQTGGTSFTIFSLQYDGVDAVPESPPNLVDSHNLGGGLGVDIAAGGNNTGILVRFASLQVPQPNLLTFVIDLDSPTGSSQFVGSSGTIASPLDYVAPFGSFVVTSGTGADLTKITSVNFRFNDNDGLGTQAADFQLDLLAVVGVPEPSSAVLLGLGGLGLIARRRGMKRRLNRN